ncbi:MAG: GntR family transcriptional regulator, partial [Planctomycetota bacterium]|nr:GntR family transcriptional regulator [Planctomycetota bacterium]
APGEFLDRRGVAREIGISPAPVLEAMLRLQEEGLLEALPRRGTRVRIITADYLLGQLLVREALECEAARLICGQKVR